jgi:2-keto-4-pentenoate hydratase/2-oxohepta-3-ene-1,7-dioic acid hydratase in catechol pathway
MRLGRIAIGTDVIGVALVAENKAVRLAVPGDDPLLTLLRDPRGLAAAARAASTDQTLSLDGATVLSPLRRPGKIIAVGLNYLDHAAETGFNPPPVPLTFAKYASSLTGPYADIRLPTHLTSQADYEAELALVIGGEHPPDGSVGPDAVAAYSVANDVSARDVQFADQQWTRAKSFDTFTPLGPWLVTADELPDPYDLHIWTEVNDERLQDDTTASMIFDLAAILAHVSAGTSLEAGDVILTGTPSGAGAFRTPPRYLAAGDRVRIGVDGIGVLDNRVVVSEQPTEATRVN